MKAYHEVEIFFPRDWFLRLAAHYVVEFCQNVDALAWCKVETQRSYTLRGAALQRAVVWHGLIRWPARKGAQP